jgi:hypothetical protein
MLEGDDASLLEILSRELAATVEQEMGALG